MKNLRAYTPGYTSNAQQRLKDYESASIITSVISLVKKTSYNNAAMEGSSNPTSRRPSGVSPPNGSPSSSPGGARSSSDSRGSSSRSGKRRRQRSIRASRERRGRRGSSSYASVPESLNDRAVSGGRSPRNGAASTGSIAT